MNGNGFISGGKREDGETVGSAGAGLLPIRGAFEMNSDGLLIFMGPIRQSVWVGAAVEKLTTDYGLEK